MICYAFSYCLFSEMMASENSFWFGYASKQSVFFVWKCNENDNFWFGYAFIKWNFWFGNA